MTQAPQPYPAAQATSLHMAPGDQSHSPVAPPAIARTFAVLGYASFALQLDYPLADFRSYDEFLTLPDPTHSPFGNFGAVADDEDDEPSFFADVVLGDDMTVSGPNAMHDNLDAASSLFGASEFADIPGARDLAAGVDLADSRFDGQFAAAAASPMTPDPAPSLPPPGMPSLPAPAAMPQVASLSPTHDPDTTTGHTQNPTTPEVPSLAAPLPSSPAIDAGEFHPVVYQPGQTIPVEETRIDLADIEAAQAAYKGELPTDEPTNRDAIALLNEISFLDD